MNENKCVLVLTLRMENALNHDYKTNNGRNYQLTNSHLVTFSSPKKEVFQVNGQISQWQIFQ